MEASVTNVRLSGDERRARILGAATQLFAERGFDAISVSEIAREAGCSKPVLYDHFASKQQLAVAAVEQHNLGLLEHVAGAVGVAADGDQAVRFEAGINAFFDFNEANPAGCRLLFRDPSPNPEVYEAHTRAHETATQGVAALLATGVEEPEDEEEFRLSVQLYARILTSALAALAAWSEQHPPLPKERLVQAMMEFGFLGLERVAAGERHGHGSP